MNNTKEVKHLIVVIEDNLKTIKNSLKDNEILEALSETSILTIHVKDMIQKLNKLNA